MSERLRLVLWMLLLLLLVACDRSDVVAPSATTPVEPEPTLSAPPVVTAPPEPAPIEEARDAEVRLADRILAGDIVTVSAPSGDIDVLLLGIPDEPRPEGPPIGRTSVHHAVMVYRLIAEEPSPPATATVVGVGPSGAGVHCERRVARARRLHVTFASSDSPSENTTATFLGLELDPGACDGPSGVIGTHEVSVFPLNDTTTRPAPADLATEIVALDRAWRDRPDELRMLSVPTADLRLLGDADDPWILTQGVRAQMTTGVALHFAVVAGWRTFLFLQNRIIGEEMLRPMEPFVSGIRLQSCVVNDVSGTALNVRRLPNVGSEVIATLPNQTIVEGFTGSTSWVRVATEPAGWAHISGLQCTELPPERWR